MCVHTCVHAIQTGRGKEQSVCDGTKRRCLDCGRGALTPYHLRGGCEGVCYRLACRRWVTRRVVGRDAMGEGLRVWVGGYNGGRKCAARVKYRLLVTFHKQFLLGRL